MKLIVIYLIILDVISGKTIKLSLWKVKPGQCHIISTANNLSRSDKVAYSISELDYNTDTTVAGENCCIL